MIKMRKIDYVYAILIAILSIVIFIVLGLYKKNISKTEQLIQMKDKTILTMETTSDMNCSEYTKYDFIDSKIAVYIELLCEELEVDDVPVFAILMKENPEFDINAINRNVNGTIDCGLFQLNDYYIWRDFEYRYWIDGVELDPFNWKHNCYLAIHHIQYLQKNLKVQDDVIMAYNCGINAVLNDNIPSSAKTYLANVKTNMKLLKNYKEKE